jgi:phospholipase/carboxylesterase
MDRRAFLKLGAAGTAGALAGSGSSAEAQQGPLLTNIPYGETRLNLSNNFRDGTLYVPKSYEPGLPMPLLMMLHGYSGAAQSVRYTFPLADEFGVIVIAPESRDLTWGQSIPGFDNDVRYLGAAYRHVSSILDVDRTHVALGGVSDGAQYALGMGLSYGDVFNHLMIFSVGLFNPFRRQGKPRIFMAHGIKDAQMPIDRTARKWAPQLKEEGYDITYVEYDGGHGAPRPVVREAFEWFLPGNAKAAVPAPPSAAPPPQQ